MNVVLWMFAAILAIAFLATGTVKLFYYETARKRWPWVADVPRSLVVAFGILEILGALGLVVPAATGIYPWLTAYAGIGLAVLMFSAGTFHGLRHESDDVTSVLLLFLMTGFVGIGRLLIVPFK